MGKDLKINPQEPTPHPKVSPSLPLLFFRLEAVRRQEALLPEATVTRGSLEPRTQNWPRPDSDSAPCPAVPPLLSSYWLELRLALPRGQPSHASSGIYIRFLLAGVPLHPALDTVTSWQSTRRRRKFVCRRQRSGAEVLLVLPAALPGLCFTFGRRRREPGTMAVRLLRSLSGSGG